LPLGLLAIPLLRRQDRRPALLPFGIALSSAFIPVAFWAQTRFRVPFVPYIIVLAAGAACEAFRRLAQARPVSLGQGMAT
jgi:hypothetical protein